jgi:hypothetical protein
VFQGILMVTKGNMVNNLHITTKIY